VPRDPHLAYEFLATRWRTIQHYGVEIDSRRYSGRILKGETFSEGLNLLHNPWAENPLDLGVLRGTTEHQMVDDGRVLTTFSRLDPVTSVTLIFQGPAAEREARDALAFLLNAGSRAR
jgi:hypothetical protein